MLTPCVTPGRVSRVILRLWSLVRQVDTIFTAKRGSFRLTMVVRGETARGMAEEMRRGLFKQCPLLHGLQG